MSKSQMAPPLRDGARPQFFIKVQRLGRPPMPWTWAIHGEGRAEPYQGSSLSYPSADEAWEAARTMLDRLGRLGCRAALNRRRRIARSAGRMPARDTIPTGPAAMPADSPAAGSREGRAGRAAPRRGSPVVARPRAPR
jgi:hypothetical protein